MSDDFLTVSMVAREIESQLGWEVLPRDISLLFYHRDIPDGQAPIIAGRRMVPRNLIADIARALRKRGWYRPKREVAQ